jgi:hypothetical protein
MALTAVAVAVVAVLRCYISLCTGASALAIKVGTACSMRCRLAATICSTLGEGKLLGWLVELLAVVVELLAIFGVLCVLGVLPVLPYAAVPKP